MKGRVNKRRSRVDSDWQNYWGSSTILQEDIIKKGESNFERKILRLCKTRGEVNYWEVKVMFEKDVLSAKLPNGDYKYYNENIMMLSMANKITAAGILALVIWVICTLI